MVRAVLNEACLLRLPDADKVSQGMLGSMNTGFAPCASVGGRFERRMTIIVALDTGHVQGMVVGRDRKEVGDRLFACLLSLCPGHAGHRDRCLGRLPHYLNLIALRSQAMTETRRISRLPGKASDTAAARLILQLCGGETLCE